MISLNYQTINTAIRHKLWLFKIKLQYLLLRIYCFNKKAIFCYGSVGDTFLMIQYFKNYSIENQDAILVGSISYKDVFRIFGILESKFLAISESWCGAILDYYFYFHQNKTSNLNFLNLNFNYYKNLKKLVRNSEINVKQALLTIAPIKNFKEKNYPVYSDYDKLQVENMLSVYNADKSKIILVNPIAYTHTPLSRCEWVGISKILEDAGYKVIFNIKSIALRSQNNEWLDCKNIIEVPMYLMPLFAQSVRLTLSRPGGAFDLAHCFSNSSDTLLFLFKEKYIYDDQESCYKETQLKNLLEETHGRTVNVIEIDLDFCHKEIGYQILDYLNH